MNEYTSVLFEEDKLSENITDVFNYVINAERVEKYRFELFEIEQKIIRNILTKTRFTQNYKIDQINQTVDKIQYLANLEQEYYHLLKGVTE